MSTFEGKVMFGLSESSEKRTFSFEEAHSLMGGHAYLPNEAFDGAFEYMPLVTSKQELIKRRNEGYDLVYFLPLTIKEQCEQFSKKHQRSLLHSEKFDKEKTQLAEFDMGSDKPKEGWGFIMPYSPHTDKSDYLTQIMKLVSDIHKEGDYYPKLRNAVDAVLTQYSFLVGRLKSSPDDFLRVLETTGIEEELVPSTSELLFHSAVVLAQSGRKTLLGELTRSRSRFGYYETRLIGAQEEEGSGKCPIKPKERWPYIAIIRRLGS